jgi:hypothetical protein
MAAGPACHHSYPLTFTEIGIAGPFFTPTPEISGQENHEAQVQGSGEGVGSVI